MTIDKNYLQQIERESQLLHLESLLSLRENEIFY